MDPATRDKKAKTIPKKRRMNYAYDESVDEPARLVEDEPVGVEAEVPAAENEPVEESEQEDRPPSPVFEDG